MRPIKSPQDQKNKEALKLFIRLFEPEKRTVAPGTTLRDLSLQRCGRVDADWISAALDANSGIEGRKVVRGTTLTLPPCPYWGLDKTIKVPASATLSHQLLAYMGTLGERTSERTLLTVPRLAQRPLCFERQPWGSGGNPSEKECSGERPATS